jgi:hypothetical protein
MMGVVVLSFGDGVLHFTIKNCPKTCSSFIRPGR